MQVFARQAPSSITTIAGKVAADQLLFAPIFLAGFFVVQGVLGERSIEGVNKGVALCENKLWEALLTNWKIWPIATMINLTYVPMQYRVLFANFIGLFWNMYLSYVSYK